MIQFHSRYLLLLLVVHAMTLEHIGGILINNSPLSQVFFAGLQWSCSIVSWHFAKREVGSSSFQLFPVSRSLFTSSAWGRLNLKSFGQIIKKHQESTHSDTNLQKNICWLSDEDRWAKNSATVKTRGIRTEQRKNKNVSDGNSKWQYP